MKRLYLYLASRSKKAGVKLITVLRSESAVSSKLTDVTSLKLPQIWERKIGQIIHDNRMDYEPWVETATDFNELRQKLQARGFLNLNVAPQLMLDMRAYNAAPNADTKACDTKKTMLRKAK